ncbi:hypothetical protein ES703_82239 [subsurface metagenome]
MRWKTAYRLAKSDYLKLVLILGLAFYIAFIPHINYPYPVHIDEWVHMAVSKAMLQAGDASLAVDPFLGQSTAGLSSNLEAGFHLFWGVFHQISGISWLTIFRYFPGVILMITVLSAYVLGRRHGFGWEAALFTCFIPTTVGILGPAFLIPIAMGLLFIPLSLFVAFNFRTWWSYLVLFVFTAFLLAIHAPTAIGMVIIFIPYILLNLKGSFRHSLKIFLALAIPFLAPFPWIFARLLSTAQGLLVQQTLEWYVDLPRIIMTYGYLPIILCLLGAFVLVIRGGRKEYGLVLGLLAILLMLVVFYTFHYGLPIVYYRGLMLMMLMLGIVAGTGLMWVKELRLPQKLGTQLKVPRLVRENIGRVLCLALVVVALFLAIPSRQGISYYHMIDEQDYEAFTWIEDNVGGDYEKAVLDPWKATPFAAITQKKVFTRIHGYPKPSDDEADAFLADGCRDTGFLRENGISIVYSRGECSNPDLVEVREYVYLLEEGVTE